MESFRGKGILKTGAITTIGRILEGGDNFQLTQSQKDTTFDSCLTEILSIQSSIDETSNTAGNQGTQNVVLSATGGVSSQHIGKVWELDPPDSDTEDDRSAKRQKLSESNMPWFVKLAEPDSGVSHASCEETRKLLLVYNWDISRLKFFIKIARSSPTGFPSSQWEWILKGDPVDLNQVFASLHHIVPDEERKGRMGDMEISFGVAEPKKHISTAAEWSASWRRAYKVIFFTFPYRKDELNEYDDYTSSHHKLLLYNVALRNEVAAGQHILLTDHNRFSRLYSAIVMPDGV